MPGTCTIDQRSLPTQEAFPQTRTPRSADLAVDLCERRRKNGTGVGIKVGQEIGVVTASVAQLRSWEKRCYDAWNAAPSIYCEATSAASTHRDDVRLRPGKRELNLSATGRVASPSAREPQLGGSVDLWSATVGSHEGSFAETMSTWSTAGAAVNSSDALALIASPAAAR